jgi:hypothetical protein
MPELIVMSIGRAEFGELHRRAGAGDICARDAIIGLWQEHEDKELACFICDNVIEERPVKSQVLPENNEYDKLIVTALCDHCFDLPPMLRLGRRLKILKRMYAQRTGKCITFSINNGPRSHPRW